MSACADTRTLFAHCFGGSPDGVWCAPGRVNLIGEHVDYADGLCLPMAIEQRTAVAVRRRADGVVRLRSAGFADTDVTVADVAARAVPGWAAYAAGVVWALALPDFAGADLTVTSDVPVGAGLSSSAALECAVALAVAELCGRDTGDAGRATLASACTRAENDFVGVPTGSMDQQISLRARAGHALLLDCRTGGIRHVPFDPAAHDLAVLVIDTAAPHRLVDGQYAQRRRAVEEAARQLGVASLRDVEDVSALRDPILRRRARHVVTEIGRVREAVTALDAGDVRSLGPVLDASHRSLREDFEVSSVELDSAVDAARDAGALGARMVGGGFGGSALALCEAGAVEQISRAVLTAAARRGLPRPRFRTVTPAAGARRCDRP
ncbi:galactokinase [Rhodococcus phenolicus]|uniref:galactokinase n=1 Tax=Rhodococcus phenolicus TaxID=263849 RepID=UPI00082C4246|nr:galactokinase [Rhodococcus phenolicus]